MLAIPDGISDCTDIRGDRFDLLCDWVEGSVLFGADDRVAQSSVVDILCEEQLCPDQDHGWEVIELVWRENARRFRSLGSSAPVIWEYKHSRRAQAWENAPAYSFCLLLGLAKCYPRWSSAFGHNYSVQGALFERLTCEAFAHLLAGARTFRTGWSPGRPQAVQTIVKKVAEELGEPIGNLERWAKCDDKDAGLDVVSFVPFLDSRPGLPAFFVQCASGLDWNKKVGTPSVNLWQKLVDLPFRPAKVLAFAFVPDEVTFRRQCALHDGVLLDRSRLLSLLYRDGGKLPTALSRDLVRWSKKRVDRLPRHE